MSAEPIQPAAGITGGGERGRGGGTDRYRDALLEFGDRVVNAEDPAEIAYVAAEIAGRVLALGRAGYGTVDAARGVVEVARDWVAPGWTSITGSRRYVDHSAYAGRLAKGDPIIFGDVEKEAPATAQTWLRLGVRAVVNLPVFERETLVAILYLHDGVARHWRGDEIAFVWDLAERTRSAVERRRAERKLQALNRTLERQVAERTADRNRFWQLSADLILVARLDGTIAGVNPAWQATLGWTEDELQCRPIADLAIAEDRERTAAWLAMLASGQAVSGFENRLRHRDGSARWLSWNAVPGEGVINAVGRDFTVEHDRAAALALSEEQLRQAQKMEAVGQLTGGLAHDFNNLLQGISGSLELVGRRLAQGRGDEVPPFLEAAQGTVKRAAAITHRLLAFARRQTLAPEVVDPGALALGMTELIRRSVGPDITVRVDAEQAADAVLCDPNQLENALLNLAINGRDAMAVGGELLVAVRATRLRDADLRPEEDAPPGDYVELRVTDTGIGMDAQTAARAFEPFFTTKPQGSGSGLGLSQIYGFVRQSGGVVRLDSELGRGTTVRLLLPRHVPLPPPDPAAAPAPGRGEEAGHDRVVLLVEDEASVQGVVALHLRDGGWRVHCAPDGASAVRMIEAGLRPDALLTDVGLPHGMNGRQLADHVRTVLPDLPVLFVTGYAGRVLDEELSPGMQVIAKPFSFADLSERLRLMLRHG